MLPTIQNIESYKTEQTYLNQSYVQLHKDIARTGIELQEIVKDKWSFDDLVDYLRPTIERLFEVNSEKLFAFFYTIDIPEKAIRAALNDNGSLGVSHAVTKLIIERELLKVLTKAYFSGRL
tara:strand:+ start:722 stop:1084 length:363 start_codon:yes stop_codon:yes gene_type:complete